MRVTVCDRKENSGRNLNWNRIAIIWLEPGYRNRDRINILQSWLDLAGFLTEFGISSSVVFSNTINFNFIMKIFVIVIELYENLKNKETRIFKETRILNLCYYYMKYLNYRETLYSMYDHYLSLILFQKESEQRSTRTIRFRVTKTPLWDSFS